MRLSDLQPYQVGPMHRVGSKNDGGYVIPKELPTIATLISFGVGDNWSFEKSCLKNGIVSNCIMYDHTVDFNQFVSRIHSRLLTGKFDFKSFIYRVLVALKYLRDFSSQSLIHVRKEITKNESTQNKTNLLEIAKKLGSALFILKVDIEGAEYEIVEQVVLLNEKIPLLLIEFHETEKYRHLFESSLEVLKKNYILSHTHANNYDGLSNDGIPKTVEITFGNRDYFKSDKQILELPIYGLDLPSTPNRSDIYLKF